jgi:hypothetical protein
MTPTPPLLLLLLLTLTAPIHTQCLVDSCQVCANATTTLCTACKSGYYLRTFSGATSTYNACWSTWKLVFGIIGALLLCYLCCALWYLCYRYGMTKWNPIGAPARRVVRQPAVVSRPAVSYIQAPVATQPSVVYSPPRSPVRYVRPSNYVQSRLR